MKSMIYIAAYLGVALISFSAFSGNDVNLVTLATTTVECSGNENSIGTDCKDVIDQDEKTGYGYEIERDRFTRKVTATAQYVVDFGKIVSEVKTFRLRGYRDYDTAEVSVLEVTKDDEGKTQETWVKIGSPSKPARRLDPAELKIGRKNVQKVKLEISNTGYGDQGDHIEAAASAMVREIEIEGLE